jgi:uncharacterized protein YndB with AHSA1/START domain
MKSREAHIVGPSDEAVRGATGRAYEEWFALLDAWDARGRRHGEIAAWLTGEHGVDNWWSQTITVEYERARGLRPPGGGRDGRFTVSASKTVAVPVERLFEAFVDEELRERWLPGGELRERTSQPGRSARFDWKDGATRVNVGFTAKDEGRSQVALAHERLPDSEAAGEARAFWRARMAALKELLEGG